MKKLPVARPNRIAELLDEMGVSTPSLLIWFPGMSMSYAQALRRGEARHETVEMWLEARAEAWRSIPRLRKDEWRRPLFGREQAPPMREVAARVRQGHARCATR